jgi:uncharacterized linocin/CFP29 family protein
MDLLKRPHAPIAEEAWKAIDQMARQVLATHLTGRKFVDVSGPHGPSFAAVGLGRLEMEPATTKDGIGYGVHRVQPLVEFRARFSLDNWELDNLLRGAKDPDLDPLIRAAQAAARFEDTAIFRGFAKAGIAGLDQRVEAEPHELPLEANPFLDAISSTILGLQRASVQGPYVLVLGPQPFRFLATCQSGYPLLRQVERLLGGPVLHSDILEGGWLTSTRGGDSELAIGQDFAVGYEHHEARTLHLFVTESLTYRVLDPTAFVPFALKGRPRKS